MRTQDRYAKLTDAQRIAALTAENTAVANENAALRKRLARAEEDAAMARDEQKREQALAAHQAGTIAYLERENAALRERLRVV